jgi:hypothetical protein
MYSTPYIYIYIYIIYCHSSQHTINQIIKTQTAITTIKSWDETSESGNTKRQLN